MDIKAREKRREVRIPLDMEGYIRMQGRKRTKKCRIKNLSLHGALIFFDKPLNRDEIVELKIDNNRCAHQVTGTVRWCQNGTLPYKIGLYFHKEVDIPVRLKKFYSVLNNDISEYRDKLPLQEVKSDNYFKLLADSTVQMTAGYMLLFFEKSIKDSFYTINTELKLVDIHLKKIISFLNEISEHEFGDSSLFFQRHFESINIELCKLKNFTNLLFKDFQKTKYEKQNNNIKDVVINLINDFYNKMNLFNLKLTYDIDDNIPVSIKNIEVLEKAIKMSLYFNMNYVLFYNADILHIDLLYEDNKFKIKIINNGSSMFKEKIHLSRNNLLALKDKNSFIDFLKLIVIVLDKYKPDIDITNQSGSIKYILTLNIDGK